MSVSKATFVRLNSTITSFVWAGKTPRLAQTTLQLALPNLQLYYWAEVLVTVHLRFSQPTQNPAVTLEAALLGSYGALSNLVYHGP